MTEHFTAVLEITRTVKTEEKRDTYRGGVAVPESRDVQEVVRLVVRADTLDTLREKLAAHVALIEE